MSINHSKLKMLYLIDTLNIGGAEQSLASILPHFHDTETVVCHLYPGDQMKHQIQAAGIPVISFDLPGQYSLSRAMGALRTLIANTQPDMVHSALFRSDVVARFVCKFAGIPLVNSMVSESYASARFQHMSPSLRLKYQMVKTVDRLTARLAYHFIANSRALKLANSRALGIPLGKVSVIYRGRDHMLFDNRQREVSRLRSELGLDDNVVVLLNVGRLVPAKNQIYLIHAMPWILHEMPNCRLLMAGDGPERAKLESAIDDLGLTGRVRLLGIRTDIPDLLRLADIFVFPSLHEGHPGAVVEAMFAECPIVVSDIPVHRETLLDGALGQLAPLGDPQALAKCVMSTFRNPVSARNLSACAKRSALQRFDIRETAMQYERLYRELHVRWRLAH